MKTTTYLLALLAAVNSAQDAADSGSHEHNGDDSVPPPEPPVHDDSEPKIDYSQHGKNWGGYCAGADQQSPINLESFKAVASSKIMFELQNYQDFPDNYLSVHNQGSNIAVINSDAV